MLTVPEMYMCYGTGPYHGGWLYATVADSKKKYTESRKSLQSPVLHLFIPTYHLQPQEVTKIWLTILYPTVALRSKGSNLRWKYTFLHWVQPWKPDVSTEVVESYVLVTQSKNYLLRWGLRLGGSNTVVTFKNALLQHRITVLPP